MNKEKSIVKRIIFILVIILMLFLAGLLQVLSQANEKVKYSELEKEQIDDTQEAQDELREYYGNLLSYVKKDTKFNTIATQDNIAILNVTIDGKDKRILTKLRTGVVFPSQPGANYSDLFTVNNLVVLGNISLKGILYSDVDSDFGSRRFFELQSTELEHVDEGLARLVNGKANVSINPILRDLISGYNIFLSAEGLTKGIYVAEKTDSYFIVKGVNPNSNIAFSWMLRGLRDGYDEGHLLSQHGKEIGVEISAFINFEDGTTNVTINGFDRILALLNNYSLTIQAIENLDDNLIQTNNSNENINPNSNRNNNSNNNGNSNGRGVNLITGNLIDEFGLETDLGNILGEASPLPDLNEESIDNGNSNKNPPINNNPNLNNLNGQSNGAVNSEPIPIISSIGSGTNVSNVESSTATPVLENNSSENSVLEFSISSTNEDFVVARISDVTGLSLAQVRTLVNFVYGGPENFEDEIIEDISGFDWIEKVNGTVIIRLG